VLDVLEPESDDDEPESDDDVEDESPLDSFDFRAPRP
jgi:hypothetical protein